ncbi:MAG: hypothetical protein M0P94_04370 [Candidatus Absconditabacterales bacterium]|nr:hypothetical protein [Candidatus Absconditabacterales bacterium]
MKQLQTPILFIIFNRLDTVKKVFTEIKKVKPEKLFIASDGPRENKKGEREEVEKIRKWILKNIDWKCKVETLFLNENIGPVSAVSGAIDWFFKNVTQGIILEHDCLPNQGFFRFCEEMLEKYMNEEKVMMVSGTNFIDEKTKNEKESYFFSKNVYIWGWASWRRAWEGYNSELKEKDFEEIKKLNLNFIERILFRKRMRDTILKKHTWDLQLWFKILKAGGLSIIPKRNLVKNIGFDDLALNTKPNKWDIKYLQKERGSLRFPLIHPSEIKQNRKLDRKLLEKDLKRVLLKKLF